jgi:heme/copper-type cytochrome/quinol oxidase subunit 2
VLLSSTRHISAYIGHHDEHLTQLPQLIRILCVVTVLHIIIAIIYYLSFTIRHQQGPRESGESKIEKNTTFSGLG